MPSEDSISLEFKNKCGVFIEIRIRRWINGNVQ